MHRVELILEYLLLEYWECGDVLLDVVNYSKPYMS